MPIIENWKLVVLERYAKFDGRSGRAEFWWFVLANIAVHVALSILAGISGIFSLIPFIGAIVLLVFVIQEGTTGPNKYGPGPELASASA